MNATWEKAADLRERLFEHLQDVGEWTDLKRLASWALGSSYSWDRARVYRAIEVMHRAGLVEKRGTVPVEYRVAPRFRKGESDGDV
jgi:Fe2+ or Zn2+ uptake regulation protein